jgi:hypothetical protein
MSERSGLLQFRHYSLLLAGAVQHRVHGVANGGAAVFRSVRTSSSRGKARLAFGAKVANAGVQFHKIASGERARSGNPRQAQDRQILIDLAIDVIHQLLILHPAIACTITIMAAGAGGCCHGS